VHKTSVGGIKEAFDSENSLLLIATQDRIIQEGIKSSEYRIIMSNRDKLLIIKE